MSESMTVSTITRDGLSNLSIGQSEPDWLTASRGSAWEQYLQTGLPTPKDDSWRKTRIEALDLSKITPTAPHFAPQKDADKWLASLTSPFKKNSGVVVSTDSNSWATGLPQSLSERGVLFLDMQDALANHQAKVRSLIDSQEHGNGDLPQDKYSLMARALFNCGAFLYVPEGVEIEAPFIIVNAFNKKTAASALFPRVLVHAGANSKFHIVNIYTTIEGNQPNGEQLCLANTLVDLKLEPGANVSYVELQNLAGNAFFVGANQSEVGRDAHCQSLTVGLGGYQLKSDVITRLTQPGAQGTIFGVALGNSDEHLSYNTIQNHQAHDTVSDINFRVALKDRSVSAYQGNIVVAKEAQKTDAHQSNKNLILGEDARADSIPRLEILADDVKCSHGATVGPVDQDRIFYLMSRGLSRKTAEELVVTGFFNKVLAQAPLESVADWIRGLVAEKVHGG